MGWKTDVRDNEDRGDWRANTDYSRANTCYAASYEETRLQSFELLEVDGEETWRYGTGIRRCANEQKALRHVLYIRTKHFNV